MKTLLNKAYLYRLWIFVFALALLIRIAFAIPLVHDWDGFVFLETAKNMLHGVTPYQTAQSNNPIIYPDSDRPMVEQWYAYPPLPLIMFTIPYGLSIFLHVSSMIQPFLQNVAIKLPFIFGDLLCAFLMKKFLDKWNKKLGTRAALLILFNPLLIWISSAWGMFDIWIVNFLLLFLLSLRSKQIILAGIFLALTLQIKLFPAFFLPTTILFFSQNEKDYMKRWQFAWAFILTTLIMDVPFFISSPQGFMNQNLLMHLARPPQGIGTMGIIDYLSYIYGFKESLFITIGSILTGICIVVFNLFSIAYVKTDEKKLLTVITLIFTSVLLFNKVVNEQYFVVLVSLLILLTHFPKTEQELFKRKFLAIFEWIVTLSVLFAAVALGFHFLTFLPASISDGFLKSSTNYLVFYFSRLIPQLPLYSYPNSLWTFYNFPVTIVYILLIPLIIISFIFVMNGLLQAFQIKNEIAKKSLDYVKNILKQIRMNALNCSLTLILIILISIPLSSYVKSTNAFKLIALVDSSQKSPVSVTKPKVGIFYNVWWNNPSHDPSIPDDAWSKTTLTPLGGYYTSKNSYFVQHIKEMKNAGIDFAVVSYHLYDSMRFFNFATYAEQLGFSYTPMIESDDALGAMNLRPADPKGNPTIGYKISSNSESSMENEIVSSLVEIKNNQHLLRIDNKPVVYIYDGHFYLPSWDEESKKELAQLVYDKYQKLHINTFQNISKEWGVPIHSMNDIIAQYPADIHEFNNSNKNTYRVSNNDYKAAFIQEYNLYWDKIKSDVEKKVGPIFLISTYQTPLLFTGDSLLQPDDIAKSSAFDDEFYYSLSNTWSYWKSVQTPSTIMNVWEKQEKDQATRDRKNGWPVFLTATPTYNDTNIRGSLGFKIPQTVNGKNIYQWTWQTAASNKADYVLIASWNEFFEGSAIEPSTQYGSTYLNATKKYTTEFKQNSLIPKKAVCYYNVTARDTLWSIAQQKLGNGADFKQLEQENKNSLSENPDIIQPGDKIIIPCSQ